MTRAVFLDRDGTVMEDRHYVADPDEVALFPETVPALLRLAEAGFALVIVTNQSGIGRGMFPEADVERMNAGLVDALNREGVPVAGVYYCPHTPDDGCSCRKPAPGMLLRAAEDLGLDLAVSAMVGDKDSDVEAGRAAGCALNLRIGPEQGDVPHMLAAADRILAALARPSC